LPISKIAERSEIETSWLQSNDSQRKSTQTFIRVFFAVNSRYLFQLNVPWYYHAANLLTDSEDLKALAALVLARIFCIALLGFEGGVYTVVTVKDFCF